MEEYINTQQAADFLQIGIKHMYKLVHQKKYVIINLIMVKYILK